MCTVKINRVPLVSNLGRIYGLSDQVQTVIVSKNRRLYNHTVIGEECYNNQSHSFNYKQFNVSREINIQFYIKHIINCIRRR